MAIVVGGPPRPTVEIPADIDHNQIVPTEMPAQTLTVYKRSKISHQLYSTIIAVPFVAQSWHDHGMDAPTLRTQRLVLLALGPGDLDEAAALYGDEAVMRYVDGGTRDRPTTSHLLEANARCWKSDGWGLWAVRDAETGAFLGEAGLQRLTDVAGAQVDYSYTISRRNWDKGIDTEAGNAILYDAWDRYRGDQIHAIVHPDDTGRAAVLRKLGFRLEGSRLIHGIEQHVWEVQRLA